MSVSQSSMGTTSKKSFQYPACRQESTGPCALQTSSSDACSRQYGGVTEFYNREICMCTNGYYNRSSECWIDCFHYGATTTDFSSISLEQAIVNVNCESYSLAAESESAFYASISKMNASYASADTSSLTSSFFPESATAGGTAVGSDVPGIDISGSSAASQGATASAGAPQSTTDWVDRPSSTQESQQGAGMSTKRAGRSGVLVSATVILVLLSVFCN